ncbi:hypothetical protein [Chryseobacterium sp.]|uniref:hypothetical protein n=1 Tax=Chryseobacterium sp. TaxID=1871047 RepID=UPI0016295B68|nr:hypothetical protein [Chryseobacterium sp.]
MNRGSGVRLLQRHSPLTAITLAYAEQAERRFDHGVVSAFRLFAMTASVSAIPSAKK